MRRGRKIIAWVVGVLLALIAILIVVVLTFDWNRMKPTVNDKVSQAIGRPFEIRGDLSVHWRREPTESGIAAWMPWPTFTALDIAVANPDWTKNRQFAHLDALEFRLSPFPLIGKRIVIPSVQLRAPQVDLERVADGRDNWTFKLPEDTGPSEWALDLHDIGFDKGHIDISDVSNKLQMAVDVTPLGKAIPFAKIMADQEQASRQQATQAVGGKAPQALAKNDAGEKDRANQTKQRQFYAFAWTAKGSYKGTSVDGKGKTGGVLALKDSRRPFPVQVDARVGETHIALVGTLTDPVNMGALDVRLWFSGKSMANLYAITGVTLPDTPPFATEGHLIANLQRKGSTYKYENFTGRVGGSDLGGSLTYTDGVPRPKLAGALKSNLLQFADLAPLIGADTNAQKQQRGDATLQPKDKVLPVEPFRTDRWKAMDADVQFTGARIVQNDKLPIDSLQTHLLMKDGVLNLDPLKFGLAGGRIDSSIRLDGGSTPMKGDVRMGARGLKLKQLFPMFQPMQTSFGEINGDMALSATGNSVSALMATSNGEVKLLINDGAISKTLLETAGLNVGNIVIGKLFGDKVVKINCAATDLVATNGVMDARLFAFDTQDAVINVDGTVDFRTEKLDLNVRPHTKGFRVFSLRSPLYVKGTLADPNVGVAAGPLLLRGGGAVALGVFAAPVAALLPLIVPNSRSQDDNTCKTLLTELGSGASKAPPAGKTMQKAPAPKSPL
jgi:uncharacterized protein involved in outer membrane biogenesis